MFNTQVDRLARITGLRQPHARRILNHRTADPHAFQWLNPPPSYKYIHFKTTFMRQRFTTLIIVSLIPGNPSKFGYKTAKPRGTKVELISFAIISTVFTKAHQLKKAVQADDGSLTEASASVSQCCVSYAGSIPWDWPWRHHNQAHWQWPWPWYLSSAYPVRGQYHGIGRVASKIAEWAGLTWKKQRASGEKIKWAWSVQQVESCLWGWSQSILTKCVCCRVRVGKGALVMMSCLLREVNTDGLEQTHLYTSTTEHVQ